MIFHIRPIQGCPGYFVSDTGRVWGPRKELKPTPRGPRHRQYLAFTAYPKRKRQHVRLHHAVANAFLGAKPLGGWVCHHNDIATDNRVENLYYGTPRSNRLDCFRNGRQSLRGEKGPSAKLTWEQVHTIRRAYTAGIAQRAMARQYGVSNTTIYHIVHNHTWRTGTGTDNGSATDGAETG